MRYSIAVKRSWVMVLAGFVIGIAGISARCEEVPPDGPYRVYYADGTLKEEGVYHNGHPEGVYLEYYSSGALYSEAFFRNGLLEDVAKKYHENGALRMEKFFRGGKLEGAMRRFYPDGTLQAESFYKDDIITGEAKEYFESGRLRLLWTYKDGVLNGPYKEYYSNGQLRMTADYVDQYLNGRLDYYNEDGSLQHSYSYEHGEVIPPEEKVRRVGKWVAVGAAAAASLAFLLPSFFRKKNVNLGNYIQFMSFCLLLVLIFIVDRIAFKLPTVAFVALIFFGPELVRRIKRPQAKPHPEKSS